ncbi:MAG: ribbon-helix-helix protein, CopG family [Actinobacteria bacterium]|nr:ribbon-helix-helix protein, CopG family [Actinomycetota bacterium]
MHMLDQRLQVFLDDELHSRLNTVAQERGVSVATVVREAIDQWVADSDGRGRAAGRRLLDATPMAVPDVGDLRQELEHLRGRRA